MKGAIVEYRRLDVTPAAVEQFMTEMRKSPPDVILSMGVTHGQAQVEERPENHLGAAPDLQLAWLGTVAPGAAQTPQLALQQTWPTLHVLAPHVALLGDAAHPILPYLGQGAVLALEDSAILGRALAAAPNIEQGLARYEAARVGRAMQMKLSVVVSLVASSLLAAALVVGCSGAGPAGESTSSSSVRRSGIVE